MMWYKIKHQLLYEYTYIKSYVTRSTWRVQIFARSVHSESANLRQGYQSLMARYLYHPQSFLKISLKSIHNFLSDPTNK